MTRRLGFAIAALAIAACARPQRPATREGCRPVGSDDPAGLAELRSANRGATLVLAGDLAWVCGCEPRALGGDTEGRRLGGDTEGRRLGGDTEGRRLGGDTEDRRLGGDTEGRRLGGDTEDRRLGGDTEGRRLSGDVEARRFGGATERLTCSLAPRCDGFQVHGGQGPLRVYDGREVRVLGDRCVR